jgi:hypothetical protein
LGLNGFVTYRQKTLPRQFPTLPLWDHGW